MKEINIKEITDEFFKSKHNRFLFAMFDVLEGKMTVKEALEFAKKD